ETAKQTLWDGVRNYQARNFLKQMAVSDRVFFYHSNCQPPGIVGLAVVTETQVIDPTQFDQKSDYFDPKSTVDNPRWQTVTVTFLEKFGQIITLDQLKQRFNPDEFLLVKKGNRLSVMPVPEAIALKILELK
ncbi:MAG: EVE domain-containing protein, partial [Microcystaceae cyanobacterium]